MTFDIDSNTYSVSIILYIHKNRVALAVKYLISDLARNGGYRKDDPYYTNWDCCQNLNAGKFAWYTNEHLAGLNGSVNK
jgi:hypothetical protein